METFDEVVEAIKEEREYQDKLWGKTLSRGRHSVSEYILYMEDYLQEARHIVSRSVELEASEKATHILRKVGAMIFSCMEQNGVQRRDMKDLEKAYKLHGIEGE